ncbi:alkaline shock response membrane anchor protein AmaP [Kitasatospora putterlickiae]|uniref:Alkaline shock response membrane anchor protein AmaP n=1 Tax=Kitasatospora putterlickiae TaxID=221725 RepID=A0ABP4J3T9_9ACTN
MKRGTVNRLLLGVVGAALLAAGVLVLAGGLDLYGRLGVDPPSWWPLTSPDQPVVSEDSRTRWSGESWWWPAVIAGLVVVVAVTAWWLVAQLRRSGPTTVVLPTPDVPGLRLRLRTRALEEAVESEAVALPEVERVGARLVRGSRRPRLRVAARMTPGGDPAALAEHFETGPRTGVLASMGLPELPADLRIRVVAARPEVTGRRRRRRGRQPRVV